MPRHVNNPGFSQPGAPLTVGARNYAGVGLEAEVYASSAPSYENTGGNGTALYNTVPQGNGEEDYEEIDADDEASIAAAAAAAAAASPARSRPSGGRGGGGSNDAAAHSTAPTNGRASAASRTTTTPRGGDGNGRTFALSRNTTLRGAETGDIDKQFAAIRKEKWNWWKQFGVVAMIILVLIIAVVSLAKHSRTTDSVVGGLLAEDGSTQATAAAGAGASTGGSDSSVVAEGSTQATATAAASASTGGSDSSVVAEGSTQATATAAASASGANDVADLKEALAALEAEHDALQERYELLEASAAYTVNGTSVAFRSEVHVGNLVLDLTAGSASLAALLADTSSSTDTVVVIRNTKVVFGGVTVVGTNVSATTLNMLLAKLEYVVEDLLFESTLTFAEGDGAVELPSLGKVDGALTGVMSTAEMTSLAFQSLMEVGSLLILSASVETTSLVLPSLLKVGGSLTLQSSDEMTSLALPSLVEVGSVLSIHGGAKMKTVVAASLTSVGTGIYIDSAATTLTATFAQFISASLPEGAIRSMCYDCSEYAVNADTGVVGIITADRSWNTVGERLRFCATGYTGFETGKTMCVVEVTTPVTLSTHTVYNSVCQQYGLTAYNTNSDNRDSCPMVGDYVVAVTSCNMGTFENYRFNTPVPSLPRVRWIAITSTLNVESNAAGPCSAGITMADCGGTSKGQPGIDHNRASDSTWTENTQVNAGEFIVCARP
eukprot:gene2629-29247_t